VKVRWTVPLLLVALAFGLAACGGDDDGGSSGSTSSTATTGATEEVALTEIPPAGECGYYELKPPADPDNILGELPAEHQEHYAGYIEPVRKSAWTDWTPSGAEPYTVGIQWAALNTDYQTLMTDQIQEDLKASPMVGDVIFQSTKDSIDVASQIQQFEALLRQEPDIIILQPIQAKAFDRQIQRAADADIPVVIAAHHIDSPYVVNVQSNIFHSSAAAASAVVRLMGGEGNVLTVHAVPGSGAEVGGMMAFEEVLSHCPDVKVGGEVTGNFVSAIAKAETLKFLASNPAPIDGILDIAAMAPGAMAAFEESGRPVPPTGDRSPMRGSMGYWAANNDSYDGFGTGLSADGMGETIAEVTLRMLQGDGPILNLVTYRSVLITDENLDEWADAEWTLDTPGIANGPGGWIPDGWTDPLFEENNS